MTEALATTTSAPPPAARSARLLPATLVGCALVVPLGMLLSYVAFLMAFLGLFFYALFGLLVGACVCRAAGRGARWSRSQALLSTTVIVFIGCGASLAWEMRGLAADMSRLAIESRQRLPEGMSKAAFIEHVESSVQRLLAERYPPGGAIGYVRWILTDGRFEKGSIEHVSKDLSRSQRGWAWGIRVALSVALLGFGVASMTWSLSTRPAPHAATGSTASTLYG